MASDLKTFWSDPGMPQDTSLEGDTVTARGTDPLVDTGGENALQPVWTNAFVPTPSGSEDSNPVSGLPTTPSRFEPSSSPPEPPSLEDRNPGTIDER
jgi:hypothetical protein